MEVSSCVVQGKRCILQSVLQHSQQELKDFILTKNKLILEQNYIASLNRKILSAIVTGKPRSAPEGMWVIGGGIETPYKYLVYADKKLKSIKGLITGMKSLFQN